MSRDTNETTPETFSLRNILQKHEEQLMDFEKNICLLCKRVFKNGDQIKRHRSLSLLHVTRMKRLRQRIFTEDQLEKIERKEREILYRDRARERRLKFGQSDRILPIESNYGHSSSKSNSSTKNLSLPQSTSLEKPLGPDNKGAALLTKMGWREGLGLGKSNEGMTDIVRLEPQVGNSGLGSKVYKVDPNLSYKEAVKQIMYRRYYEDD